MSGTTLLKEFEGFALTSYQDGGGVWTIGIGHTGPEVRAGLTLTEEDVYALFQTDIAEFEDCVNAALQVPLTQNQFDALVCLAFNIGCKTFRHSTLVTMLNEEMNPGVVSAQFLRWNHDNGKVVDGLTRRRAAERELFLKESA